MLRLKATLLRRSSARDAAAKTPVAVTTRLPDGRPGGRHQPGRAGRISQLRGDEVGPPVPRQPGAGLLPGVGGTDGQVGAAVRPEGAAETSLARAVQVLVGEVSGDGTEEVA